MNQTITIEQVEQLVAEIEGEEQSRRERLRRLIRAYARILAVREPKKFPPAKTEVSDEDGHWDNSYPPKIDYKDPSGPQLLCVHRGDYDMVATEGGFYHSWRAVTSDRGLYVLRDGRIFGRKYEGTGQFGQFAAHPGNCGVMIEVSYDAVAEDDLTTDDLVEVERTLRGMAFPLATAAAEAN